MNPTHIFNREKACRVKFFLEVKVKKKRILTVHDGLDPVYWAEDNWSFPHGGVDETKPLTAQAWRGHDLLQSEALLALAHMEFSSARKRDAYIS